MHYSPTRIIRFFLCSTACLFLQISSWAENLVSHGDFKEWKENRPEGWIIRSDQEYSQAPDGGLAVKIVNGGGRLGEIIQKVAVEPGQRYRLAGQLKGTKQGVGLLQIKLYVDGRESSRVSSGKNEAGDWQQEDIVFTSDAADEVGVLLRWYQGEEHLGEVIAFKNIVLEKLPPLVYSGDEVAPRAVPTFNSIGLYWKPNGGAANRNVSVAYRKKGESTWNDALPLWFDATVHSETAEEHTAEYRGSIVQLDPGTRYEVRLSLENGPERVIEVDTWSEDFKIARKITVPADVEDAYTITEGGSPDEGYVLYEPEPGIEVTWDAKGEADYNIQINASWVIVRGLTLKGAAIHGIVLRDVNHIVIEDCDISGWGTTGEDGQAKNLNSAIYSSSRELEHVVVQNCNLHHPRSDSNSWQQQRPGTKSKHPVGPQGISFKGPKGSLVIRYNRIHSDMDHMFNDGMGETSNFSYGGFPNRDSDIHDNFVSHCWDDGLEIEGADMNVRVWNNYIDMTYGAIGAASPSLGPLYIFRNVYGVSRKHSGTEPNDYRGHYLVKLGGGKSKYTRGRLYIFHNTTLQPPPFEGFSDPSSGAQSGLVFTSYKKQQENITSRNNILQMRKDKDWAIRDTQKTFSNDFDYDMYDGRIMVREGGEANGVVNAPTYERSPDGRLWLVPGTAGHDAGAWIPNFNDDFTGEAPDLGAIETNSVRPKPRLWPVFPENYQPAQTSSSES